MVALRIAPAVVFAFAFVASSSGCRRAPEELPPPSTVESATTPKPTVAPIATTTTTSTESEPKAVPSGPNAACPKDPDPPTTPVLRPIEFPEAKAKLEAEIARTEHEVTRGLMYRTSMPEDRGMLFRMPRREEQIFWMRNTCISLDMLFLDDDGTVVGILENVPTLNEEQRTVRKPSRFVLETNGGWCKAHGVKAGMKAKLPG